MVVPRAEGEVAKEMEFPYQNMKTLDLDLESFGFGDSHCELCEYTKSTELYTVKGVVWTCEWHPSYP